VIDGAEVLYNRELAQSSQIHSLQALLSLYKDFICLYPLLKHSVFRFIGVVNDRLPHFDESAEERARQLLDLIDYLGFNIEIFRDPEADLIELVGETQNQLVLIDPVQGAILLVGDLRVDHQEIHLGNR